MTLSARPAAEKYAHVPTASSATTRTSTAAMVHFFFMHKPPFSLRGCFQLLVAYLSRRKARAGKNFVGFSRVKITPEVVAANGELVPLTDRSLLTLDLNDTDWIPGADGYYYGRCRPRRAVQA